MRKAVLAFLILAVASPCLAKYSGGSGEPNDPYQIANVGDLLTLSNDANDYNKSFILTADINLAGLTFNQAPIAPDTNSATSGFQGTKFTGIFDGNSHIISNLTITASTKDYIGLFGYVGSGGQIRNLGVEDVYMTGHSAVGGLVGSNSGSLTSCYSTGSVNGTGSGVGGLVGSNSGTVTICYATGTISGDSSVGGLVGSNNSTLNACYATGSVTGNSSVGGLVGINNGTLTSCYSTGSVNGTGSGVGGLVGYNYCGSLTSCYATGSVTGIGEFSYAVGGLVGWNDGSITSCYANGSVTGNSSVGGLVGVNRGALTSCYANGSVTGNSSVGGLVGENRAMFSPCVGIHITTCFWDIQTSGKTVGVGYGTDTGVTGKTTAEMKTLSTFTSPPASWDFTTVWTLCEGTNYPRLQWQIPAGDFVCPDGVDIFDLAELCEQWLFEEIPADLAPPPSGDGIVDFADFAIFANQWGITNDIVQLLDFTGQWLKMGLPICSADISPLPDGDGRVNAADFALMANDWLDGF